MIKYMNNYLITWFYAEKKEDESFYPSVGGNTSSPEFHEVYWKCVYDFFESVLLTQDNNIKLLFFTNVTEIPKDIEGRNLQTFLIENNIEVIHLELTNRTPSDWYKAWRNQFYVFDILNYCLKLNGNLLILDSDCFVRKSLIPVFEEIKNRKIITYFCGHGIDEQINGISTSEMRKLYHLIFDEQADSLVYCGGEFIGMTTDIIPKVLDLYHIIWEKNYEYYTLKQKKLNEEAHFLSLIYYRLGCSNSIANKYIRRMWTALKYDNVLRSDKDLSIWHLPAEKKYGFKKIYAWFGVKERSEKAFLKYLERYFCINSIAIVRKVRKLGYKFTDRFI